MAASKVTVGEGACVGDRACILAGPGATEVDIAKDACVGKSSCDQMGPASGGKLAIEQEACGLELGCFECAKDFTGDVSVTAFKPTCPSCDYQGGQSTCQAIDASAGCTDGNTDSGGFTCTCTSPHYEGTGTISCTDVDECAAGNPCNSLDVGATCTNVANGGYTCTCSSDTYQVSTMDPFGSPDCVFASP